MKKRILSILLTLCMVLCLVPTSVFAEGEAATGTAAIQFCTDGIHGYNATDGYSYIYYGVHNGNPVKWRVLDTKTNTGEADALFLLTDECMGSYASGYIQFNPAEKADRYLWKGSSVQTWCGEFYNTVFTAAERALIPAVSAPDSVYSYRTPGMPSYYPGFKYQTGGLEAEYVFAPSIQELCNADYGFTDSTPQMAGPFDSTSAGTRYWIRSYFNNLPYYVGEYANMTGDQIATSAAVRPAMNLSTAGSNIPFTSAAVGGKPDGGLTAIPAYDGNEWKLTLSDSSRNSFAVTTTSVSASTKGDTVEISYTGAKTGENEYISALITDESGNPIYYGHSNAPLTETDGTAKLTVPVGFAEGTYTLKVFNEQYNGDYKTDLASGFTDVTLTVEKRVDEQFTLTPGGRYYFDLSAMDIPGTVNSALPDSTLHYVPFTYVGTVDAYKRTGVSDKNTDAYEHSLFIADYAVTHTVSWNDLNARGMIFGKAYTSGGIDYTLRAPSVGRDYTGGGETKRGAPINNEWDTIFDKAKQDRLDNTGGYIKNWKDILSFGQEGYGDINDNPAVRGYYTAFFYNYTGASSAKAGYGYRPVLELPTGLSADSLKVVELLTDGRMPGETYYSINIIVKNGESFKAPSAEGLPLSANTAADTPMWWVDENLNFYKPGDTVPASVSKLTAFYGGFGLLLDRGNGAVEVTPDNYTDIFGDGTASFVVPKGEIFESIAESGGLTATEQREILTTGRLGENIFPNLQLKNADLTYVTLNDRYIGQNSPLFITLDGKNTIGSLNEINRASFLSILGDGALTLNNALTLSQYAQYGGSSVTMAGGLNVYNISVGSGSLTVTGDTQAITFQDQRLSNLYMGDGVRLFLGSSAQDAVEAAIPQLSAEMQEVYQRYQADDPTLTREEYSALSKALKEQFDAILPLFSGKTYVRIVGAWDVTYQPGTNGTGDIATDVKFYGDALTLKGKLFTRTGYTQIGWATVDGGEKIYGLDAVYTQNEALTLYPVWNTNQYKINVKPENGEADIVIKQDFGTAVTAPTLTRKGYAFDGWDTEFPTTMPAEDITIKALWKDVEKPTGKIEIGKNAWNSFLNKITFGLFFNKTQTVNVTATDNSGETVKIEYLLSNKELTAAELKNKTFTAYNGQFNINPDNEYIVYVKLTDKAGNTDYICSEGIVLDKTKPVIVGIKEGTTYCESQTVTINEKYIDIEAVKVNGTKVTLDKNNRFVLEPKDGEQQIVVTDKAGNQAIMTVTVNDGHTLLADDDDCTTPVYCKFCNAEVVAAKSHNFTGNWLNDETDHWHICQNENCTVTDTKVAHSRDDDGNCLTAVVCECGYVITAGKPAHTFGEWKSNGDGTHTRKCTVSGCTEGVETENCSGGKATCKDKAECKFCGTAYGKTDPNNHADLTHITAKAATKEADGNVEYWHCESCDKYYSDVAATKEISKADTVTERLKEETKSPKTGDSNDFALWIALLFVCGGTVISTAAIKKKRSVK